MDVSDAQITALGDQLLNASGSTPLHTRFRALFTLKAVCSPDPSSARSARVIDIIASGLTAPTTSALLRHELAYVLGQIGSTHAVPSLVSTLEDVQDQEEMVRHEAAEALAAIGHLDDGTVGVLRKWAKAPGRGGADDGRVVRETCEIALDKIAWNQSEEARASQANGELIDRQFTSVDPAPPLVAHSPLVTNGPNPSSTPSDVPSLRTALLDTSSPLFIRYRAMFALRNIGTPDAIDALCDGFEDDSALFKHEIAFILGQLAHPHSIPALVRVLQKDHESAMVRHESAEALGGIPSSEDAKGGEVLKLLREWANKGNDAPDVVRDSCIVAVDMWEYENSDQFQYADGLSAAAAPVPVASGPAAVHA